MNNMVFKFISKIAYVLLMIIETSIVLRFLLKLIGSSEANALVSFVYKVTDFFVKPFYGIVQDSLAVDRFTVDIASLVALVFYMILAFIAVELAKIFSRAD